MGDRKTQDDDCGRTIDMGALTAMDVVDHHPSTKILAVII